MSEITETVTETVPETMEETNIKCPRLILSELWTKLHEKQWIFSAAGGLTIKSGEDIYMTPKNNSPSDLKPEDIYVFDNEDVNDISEAPEHLEISPSAEIFMEILKLKTPGVVLHSVNNKALVLTHLVRGNEYRIKNHPMVKAIKVQPAKEASESDENNKVEDPMLKVPILYDPKKLSEKLEAHPHTPAVLIKGQGLFVWAKDFDECILRTEALHQMFEYSIEMKKLGLNDQTQNAPNKSQIKKPAENGPKKPNSITPAQASAIAKNKPEVRKNIAQRPAAANGVKTGRVKKNFMKNKNNTNNRGQGGNTQEFRNVAQNGANNKGNSGGGGQNWNQNRGGQKKQKQNMNVLMNY